jgi:hypothetical protein
MKKGGCCAGSLRKEVKVKKAMSDHDLRERKQCLTMT